jgi:hypothetical protein
MEAVTMKKKTWLLLALSAFMLFGLLSGCSGTPGAPTTAPASAGNAQIANPWVDATVAEAAKVLGGTMYNITTLDDSYTQYALIVTTDDAVKGGSLPTAWVRFHKTEQDDVSLQIFKGGKLSDEQLKGKEVSVNGLPAYILSGGENGGVPEIAWENGGLLFTISTSPAMNDDALVALAQGVKPAG